MQPITPLLSALTYSVLVILASSGPNAPVNQTLQKFLAIVITTFTCQLLAFSRSIYIKISYVVIIFKVSVLCFIALAGLISLTGARRHSPDMIDTPYGLDNLRKDFSSRTKDPFQYSIAMLNIMRAYLGYENANFVRRPSALLTKCIVADVSRYLERSGLDLITMKDALFEEQLKWQLLLFAYYMLWLTLHL